MTTDPTPPQQRGREREMGGVGGGGRGREKTTHEDTFEDIFTHSLYTRSQHLMSRSYWRLQALCWVLFFYVLFYLFLSFPLRSGETPRANSKGREVSALLTCQKSEVPLRMTNALLGGTSPPVAAAPPRLPIETHYDLLGFFSEGAMPRALLFPPLLFQATHTSLYLARSGGGALL